MFCEWISFFFQVIMALVFWRVSLDFFSIVRSRGEASNADLDDEE
jgi:hypothetical protein